MIFKDITNQAPLGYAKILMVLPPLVGPALCMYPNRQESFFILEGEYLFAINPEIFKVKKGDFVKVIANILHKYKSGILGGRMLVKPPPNVEKYFLHIAEELIEVKVSLGYKFEFAKQNRQTFLDKSEHLQ